MLTHMGEAGRINVDKTNKYIQCDKYAEDNFSWFYLKGQSPCFIQTEKE